MMMQGDYMQLTGAAIIWVVGLALMYGSWLAKNRVLAYHKDPSRQSWTAERFMKRPELVSKLIPAISLLGASISWIGYVGLQSWLGHYSSSVWTLVLPTLFFLGVYVVVTAIMVNDLRGCLKSKTGPDYGQQ